MGKHETLDANQPGGARCPGPSTRDIILEDPTPTPAAITQEAYSFMGSDDVSYAAYTDPAYHTAEMQKMWPNVWQMACREEHIPEVGDATVYDVGDISIILIRQRDMSVKAFVNACMHRGMQLLPCGARESLKTVRCPFHGFTWATDGKLLKIPCEWDFPHVDKEEFKLDEVHVAQWGGFIFVTLKEDPEPLETYLEVMPEHFQNWPLEKRHLTLHVQKILPANWKLAQEAFLEAYHVLATHPQGLPTAGDANAQYDVFGDNVSRFVHTLAYPSPHLKGSRSEPAILKALGGEELGLELKEGQTAREVYAQHLRETLGKQMEVDLSDISISEMIDSIEYFCFPNFFVFPGISLPMVYRFRPNGNDVDSCIFDLMFLSLTKPGETPPKAPDPIKIGVETPFVDVPDMAQGLAYIYDQDVDNLDMQTRGIKASRKTGQTLGNYQEVRIRAMRQTLDKYLSA
jgi:phenylpropionate dioxygenase-like ring-hydroxylating dioxygenase large terminal subunit